MKKIHNFKYRQTINNNDGDNNGNVIESPRLKSPQILKSHQTRETFYMKLTYHMLIHSLLSPQPQVLK